MAAEMENPLKTNGRSAAACRWIWFISAGILPDFRLCRRGGAAMGGAILAARFDWGRQKHIVRVENLKYQPFLRPNDEARVHLKFNAR